MVYFKQILFLIALAYHNLDAENTPMIKGALHQHVPDQLVISPSNVFQLHHNHQLGNTDEQYPIILNNCFLKFVWENLNFNILVLYKTHQ
jgi:hypothetical protein